MNLAVSNRVGVLLRVAQICRFHGDHDGLLFLAVDVLHEAVEQQVRPPHRVLLQAVDVLLLYRELLVLVNNEKRAAQTAVFGVQPHLAALDVPHNTDFAVDIQTPPQLAKRLHKVVRVSVDTDPIAVYENLRRVRESYSLAVNLLEIFSTPLLQVLQHASL